MLVIVVLASLTSSATVCLTGFGSWVTSNQLAKPREKISNGEVEMINLDLIVQFQIRMIFHDKTSNGDDF